MITERDLTVYEFIRVSKLATTTQIHKALFENLSKTIVSRCLNKLVDYGYVERKTVRTILQEYDNRDIPTSLALQIARKDLVHLSEGTYIYYTEPLPHDSLLVHELIGTNFIASFYKENIIVEVSRNKKIGTVTPDINIKFEDGSYLFVEIQNVTNPIKNCTRKYTPFLKNKEWTGFGLEEPEILIVSKEHPGEPFSWCNIYSIL